MSETQTEVGWFEARTPITVGREPEVGIMWLAESKAHSRGALGKDPREAVRNLFGALSADGIGGQGYADERKLDAVEAPR
jgi:hypothetical protein